MSSKRSTRPPSEREILLSDLAHLAQRAAADGILRSEEHTSELQSQSNLVCRLLLEKTFTSHTPHADSWITRATLGKVDLSTDGYCKHMFYSMRIPGSDCQNNNHFYSAIVKMCSVSV